MGYRNFSPCLLFFIFAYICLIPSVSCIVCYKCNSLVSPECAMSLDAADLPYEDCKSEITCIMSIVDAVTYRGCGQSTPTTGATYKKTCSQNLCNKGVFPPGRLKCHHCSGAVCGEKPNTKPRPCLLHNETDECYTEVLSISEVNRGCRSDANHTASDAATVLYCDINGCNNEPAVNKLQCARCDSKMSRGCKMDLSSINQSDCRIKQYEICEVDTWLTKKETCFLYHHLDRVVRGCTKNMPDDIREDVRDHPEHIIIECDDTDLCNAKCLAQQRCLVCDSAKNEMCRSNTTSIVKSTCGSAEISSCFSCESVNWQVTRDCGPPPIEAMQDGSRCFECNGGVGCNEMLLTRCYKCSTNETANCASWERPGPDIDIEECAEPNTRCIMAGFGSTVMRGCQSQFLNCNDSVALTSCQSCYGSFCNSGAFPSQRLRCFQCNGSVECENLENDPLPCPESILEPADAREACFEFYSSAVKGMVRGCRSSNAQLYYKCIFQSGAGVGCRVCYHDGCNNSPVAMQPLLSCYQCNNSDLDCRKEQTGEDSKVNLKKCKRGIPFGFNESCFITRHIDGSTSRGCTLDVKDTLPITTAWDQTDYCHFDGCNFPATILE